MGTSHCFTNLLHGFRVVLETAHCGSQRLVVQRLIKAGIRGSHAHVWRARVSAPSVVSWSSTGGSYLWLQTKLKSCWPLLRYRGTWKSLNYCVSSVWFGLITQSCRLLWDLLMGPPTPWGDSVETLPAQLFPQWNCASVIPEISSCFFWFTENFSMEKVI